MKSKAKNDSMSIRDCMKRNVISISETSTIREAAAMIVKKHIGLLPVVDKDNKLVGVVGMRDLLNLELPDFVRFIEDLDFVHDFGAVETTRPPARTLEKPIKSLMKEVETVDEECGLLRAYALMLQHDMHDMPVVSKDGELIGVASRVDIGAAILSSWAKVD
jgi:CBS-domain-containing membrane protein